MSIKHVILCTALVLTAGPALAADIAPPPDPTIQALGQMLQEAQVREAQANTRAYAEAAQIKTLQDQIAAANKRADEAEAKTPKPAAAGR